jgi:formylglycine-generating enzyme required for sulfatase activity
MRFLKHITIVFILLFCQQINSYSQRKTFSAKNIETQMAKVNDTLYACRYETSNREYNTFLNELVAKDPALYGIYFMDSAQWNIVYSYGQPMTLNYHRHPAFGNYPAVNMSYEGAIEYCKWLTSKYNADTKRKFRQVIFVLPLEEEWVSAAQGGHPGRVYPWSSYYLVNKKGMYMCNFNMLSDSLIISDSLGLPVFDKIVEKEFNPSGLNGRAFYCVEVKSFFPNDFGIYNTSGNVAEMINTKDYAMGGSWKSYGGEVTTTSKKQYKQRSPEVGFRVFMKIIEP